MSDWIVKVEYKNKNMETVVEKEYDFHQYVEMLRLEIMRVILEVEDSFYTLAGNKQKEDWDDETKERFKRIRHKLLDQANAIKRLPENLYHNGQSANQLTSAEFIERMMNK